MKLRRARRREERRDEERVVVIIKRKVSFMVYLPSRQGCTFAIIDWDAYQGTRNTLNGAVIDGNNLKSSNMLVNARREHSQKNLSPSFDQRM